MPQLVATLAAVLMAGLLCWRLFRTRARFRAGQRRAPSRPAGAGGAGTPVPPAAGSATPSALDTVAVVAAESRARAFPVHGMPPGQASAGALEGILRRVGGVTAAYVSPVTALAYLAYVPAQVTEEQLVEAIRQTGYRVGEASRRFDWRHAPHRD